MRIEVRHISKTRCRVRESLKYASDMLFDVVRYRFAFPRWLYDSPPKSRLPVVNHWKERDLILSVVIERAMIRWDVGYLVAPSQV